MPNSIGWFYSCNDDLRNVFKNKKNPLIFCVSVAIVIVASNDNMWSIIQQSFLLNKYSRQDLNTMSRGRLELFEEALCIFQNNILFGSGNYYVDDFYLCVLSELGLLGGIPVILIWAIRFTMNYKLYKSTNNQSSDLKLTLLCLTGFYLIESFLEAVPPFGPGALTFLFWFLCGYLDKGEKKIDPLSQWRDLFAT